MGRVISPKWVSQLFLLIATIAFAGKSAMGQTTLQPAVFQCSSGCSAGQYAVQTCDTAEERDWLCATCRICSEGSYEKTPCSGTEDTECESCRVCGEGEVEVEACRDGRDTLCGQLPTSPAVGVTQTELDSEVARVECGECAEGQFLVAECDESAGKDRECQNCSECGEGEEVVSVCHKDEDTKCASAVVEIAVECGGCPDGQFVTRECDIEAGEDRKCRACSDRCGEGVIDCISDGKGDALCSRCNFGDGLFTDDRDGDGYGECKFCSPCEEGEYLKTRCSGFGDNVCEECSSCGSGEVEVEPCRETADTVCQAQTQPPPPAEEEEEEEEEGGMQDMGIECGACPEGYFITRECDEETGEGRECRACSERCGEGVVDCIADGKGDALCSRCNFGDGLYVADGDGDGYGECKFCSPCEEGEYLKTRCSGFDDNVCEECSRCGSGEEEVEPCGEAADTVCVAEAVRAERPTVTARAGPDRELIVVVEAPAGHREEDLLVAYVYRLNHFDADDLSEPSCEGLELQGDESGDIVAAPAEVALGEEWVSLAVRLCPKPGTATYTPSRIDRSVRSACSCYNVQYAVQTCDPETGALVECALCEQCGSSGDGFGQCRGPGEDDCLSCGGSELELELVDDGEAGRCVKECENVCEEGRYLSQPCDERGEKECRECSTCDKTSSEGEDLYEVRACNSSALVDGDAVCAVMQEAPVPEVAQSVSQLKGETKLQLDFGLPNGNTFDDFYIVYSLHENEDDYDDIDKPDCDDSEGGRVDHASESVLLLDPEAWWGVGLRACPRDTLKGFKVSNSVKLVTSACSCGKGLYPDVPCSPEDGALVVCAECEQCGEGGECVGPGVGECTRCGDGDLFFLPLPNRQSSVGECRVCSEECPVGQFRTEGCSETSDITCKSCNRECASDEIEVVPCGGSKDRQCLPKSEATAPAPVVDEDDGVQVDRRGRLEVHIELKGVSYDDFEIGYIWVPGNDLARAPVPVCNPDDPDSVNFSDEDVELKRDEDWITVSAITCPKDHVNLLRSEVVSWAFSACHCPVGFYVSKECEKDGPIRDCERCRVCSDDEVEVSPCENGRNRECAPPQSDALPGKGQQLPSPMVHKGWADDGGLNIQISPPEDDSKFVLFKTAVVSDSLDAEAIALSDCDSRLDDTASPTMVSGSLTSVEASPKVLNFAGDAVVKVSAITCPVGDDAFSPSKPLTMQLSLCGCGPNEYEAEACDELAGVPSSCINCEEACGEGGYCNSNGTCTSCGGDGVFLSDGKCVSCSVGCQEGSFMSAPCSDDADVVCQTCSDCVDGEVVVAACSSDADTVCKAAPSVPTPLITASVASLQAFAAGDPALLLSVDLPPSTADDEGGDDAAEWFPAYTTKATTTDTEARDVLASLPDPQCGDDASEFIDVNGLRSAGEYGWLAVKAVACRVKSGGEVADDAPDRQVIQSEVLSVCSCPSGSFPTRSCDLSRGESVQCTPCANDNCPTVLPPPAVVSQAGRIVPNASVEAEVVLYGSEGAMLRYIVNESATLPDFPCNSTSPMFSQLLESPATIALPIGRHIIRAFSCRVTDGDEAEHSTFYSYTRTASVVVHEAYQQKAEGADARVGAVDTIALTSVQLVQASNGMTVEEAIAMRYSAFIKGGLRDAQLDGDVVVDIVNEASSTSQRKLSEQSNATATYEVSYVVLTTADKANTTATFLESYLQPGTSSAQILGRFLEGAAISSHSSEVTCSIAESRDCEVEWTYVAQTCAAILDIASPVRCGKASDGYVATPAGKCGTCPQCPTSSCAAVEPCPECECNGGCGSSVAVSQDGPGRQDRIVEGNREKVDEGSGVELNQPDAALPEGDEFVVDAETSPLPEWIWIAVGAGAGGVLLAGVILGAVFVWRRRKSKEAEDGSRDFTFSNAYEQPRGRNKNGGSQLGGDGDADAGEVHVTVTDNNGSSGIQNEDSVELTLTDSEMDEDIPQDML